LLITAKKRRVRGTEGIDQKARYEEVRLRQSWQYLSKQGKNTRAFACPKANPCLLESKAKSGQPLAKHRRLFGVFEASFHFSPPPHY